MGTTPAAASEPLLRLLGLGVRARTVVLGVEPVRTALKAGKIVCVIAAADLSPRANEKVVRLAQAKKIPVVPGPTAGELGERLGRPAIMVAGVLDRALARGLMQSARVEPRRED
ncbi:MAG: hypothetical protein E4H38_02210 [Gemmatimonadales bacterium]|nr:MAG: hypothetical protein E4H38_02210 [Gemmatimonadales bacterium]